MYFLNSFDCIWGKILERIYKNIKNGYLLGLLDKRYKFFERYFCMGSNGDYFIIVWSCFVGVILREDFGRYGVGVFGFDG